MTDETAKSSDLDLFDPHRVYRYCATSSGMSAHQSGEKHFCTPGKCGQIAFRRCGESVAEVRADKGFAAGGIYLVFQPADSLAVRVGKTVELAEVLNHLRGLEPWSSRLP